VWTFWIFGCVIYISFELFWGDISHDTISSLCNSFISIDLFNICTKRNSFSFFECHTFSPLARWIFHIFLHKSPELSLIKGFKFFTLSFLIILKLFLTFCVFYHFFLKLGKINESVENIKHIFINLFVLLHLALKALIKLFNLLLCKLLTQFQINVFI